jgi:hypothetical protein
MSRYEIINNVFHNIRLMPLSGAWKVVNNVFHNIRFMPPSLRQDGAWRLYLADQRRPVVDCQPNGKWRIGDTIGSVPRGHDCVIEGFMVRGGKTVRKGKVTHVPNGGGDVNYILRGNDVG